MNLIDSFTALQDLRAALEAEQWRINEEIRSYPPPIPRCDAQFNGLLEERAAVAQALYDLDAITRDGAVHMDADELTRAIYAASDLIQSAAGQRVRAALANAQVLARSA